MIDETEFQLKAEQTVYEAEEWWDRLEPEDKIQIYFRELKRLETEVDAGDEE